MTLVILVHFTGSIMIFVGILSVIFLKKKMEWFHWTGMAVVFAGILLVGGADFMKTDDEGFDSKAIIGDIIIICAQVLLFSLAIF